MGGMRRVRGRWVIGIALLAVVAAAAVWWALPRLPGRVRHYLPAPVAALVTTPLPTALPAPTGPPAAAAELALLVAVPTPPLATAPPTAPIAAATTAPRYP